jgi:hypothetical protein
MLQRYRDEGDFLLSIMTGNESWFHISTLKRSGRVWIGIIWVHQQKINQRQCWDAEGRILILFLEPERTINAAHYVQTLLKLRRALRDERPVWKVILQHDNAGPHTARLTLDKLRKWDGNFSLTLHTVLIWHPPITISFGFVMNQI